MKGEQEGGARWLIGAAETPMLWLAGVAVALYLCELQGLWTRLGVETPYAWVSFTVDAVFVADLVLKIAVLRRAYWSSPWLLVDFISSVPILAQLTTAPFLAGLRMFRFFRLFRTLRVLRVLRSLRVLNLLRIAPVADQKRTQEDVAFDRALRIAVLLFVALFLAILAADGAVSTPEQHAMSEFYLVLGTVLGMALVLYVVRYQVPALTSRQVRSLLNVALPHQVADHFMEHPEAYNKTVRMPATVLFCDIEGFTSTVESLEGDLDQLKKHLEAALDAIVSAHLGRDLIVDKFIGDAVMSFRGGDLAEGAPEENAWRVVRAALDGSKALASQNNPFFRRIKMGGASADDVLIGAFGTTRRLSYTVLGDRVNLAARLEGSCKALGAQNLFCGRTKALTAGRKDIVWRRVGTVAVQGKGEETQVFEAFDASDDTAFVDTFHRGLELMEQKRFDEAISAFQTVDALRDGGDAPSQRYIERCREWTDGVPEGWTPVVSTRK